MLKWLLRLKTGKLRDRERWYKINVKKFMHFNESGDNFFHREKMC